MNTFPSLLPVLVVALPCWGSLGVAWAAKRGSGPRNTLNRIITAGTLLLSIWQFLAVEKGVVLTFALPWSLGFGLQWRVDFISALFGLVVALIWFLATLFAEEYMLEEQEQTRFFTASLFTLGSTLGVFLAGDLFSLFLFFELMTFAAYLLVVHEENAEALEAGSLYLYLSVIGGLFLLGTLFLLQHHLGTTEFSPALDKIVAAGLNPWGLLLLVMLGFGVKAGMLPLHIWLPKAHPIAPAPASALLSALMIKTGAYGFLRFLYVIFSSSQGGAGRSLAQDFGYIFLWMGALTMLGGALMALVHSGLKRILAYSSISQMGYILFSLGCGVFLGSRGAFGFAGAWLHMLNHAVFKSFLFLLAGAVYLQTGELDLKKLGGLKKRMPLACLFFLAAAAAISGIPGFNGYLSKVLIHEGISTADQLQGWPALLWLERIFVFTGGLTAAYISKIYWKTFWARPQKDWSQVRGLSRSQKVIFLVYTLVLLGLGLFPQRVIARLVLPAAGLFPFRAGDLAHLGQVPFWSLQELKGPLFSYLIAGGVLAFSALLGPNLSPPRWLSVELLFYRPLYNWGRSFLLLTARLGERIGAWRPALWPGKPSIKFRPPAFPLPSLKRPRLLGRGPQLGAFWAKFKRRGAPSFRKIKAWLGLKAAQAWAWVKERTGLIFDTIVLAVIFLVVLILLLTKTKPGP